MKRLRKIQQVLHRIGSTPGADADALERFAHLYARLSADDRIDLFRWMGSELEVPRSAVAAACDRLLGADSGSAADWTGAMQKLREAVASPRLSALENLIALPGGMRFLLDMRAEVLEAERAGQPGLEALDRDIAEVLNGWFQHGFLFVEEIDRHSPFSKIQYLKERELVHPMVGLEEMGDRLGQDRMCFALEHVAMPDQPVVFIEVALSRGLVRSIHDIIGTADGGRPPVKSPDTAIFYSINNTETGLTGLGLGKVLVFRVTEALRGRHPGVKTLATLSPVPGFRTRYLLPILRGEGDGFALSRDDLLGLLPPGAVSALTTHHKRHTGTVADVASALAATLSDPTWIDVPELAEELERPLVEIAYRYLAEEIDPTGKPINPVAGFHLGNGARIVRKNVNFGANTSKRGMLESCGIMVNYLYSPGTLSRLSTTVTSFLPWARR